MKCVDIAALILLIDASCCVYIKDNLHYEPVPWRPSPNCMQRPKDEQFLVVLSAREGMNKNVAMIAQAVEWAILTKRSFVEPAVCDSRIVSPFENLNQATEIVWRNVQKAFAQHPSHLCGARKKLGFSAYWDLEPSCQKVPIVPLDQWLDWWRQNNKTSIAFHINTDNKMHHQNQETQFSFDTKKILFVSGWYRSLANHLITSGACTLIPCFRSRILFPRSSSMAIHATRILKQLLPAKKRATFTCVQWRSETKCDKTNILSCARVLLASVLVAWRQHPSLLSIQNEHLIDNAMNSIVDNKSSKKYNPSPKPPLLFRNTNDEPPVTLFVSDIMPNTSATYSHVTHHPKNQTQDPYQDALDYLKLGLGLSDSSLSAELERYILDISDFGLRSLISQDLCAAAPILIMCLHPHRSCSKCARGLDSGFVAGIYNIRKNYNRKDLTSKISVITNTQHGIWQWPIPSPPHSSENKPKLPSPKHQPRVKPPAKEVSNLPRNKRTPPRIHIKKKDKSQIISHQRR
mmetsp:Transcript_9277/g.14293  ORF Transcript_9277/g.14293 Transcript_9277/m.14293 type:complete len:518 (-) Transcript_9277:372-1925(-)